MAEVLNVVYSDEYNAGDYYMWADENPGQENRDGFFVTTVLNEQGKLCIKIGEENDDIFGVTVDSAAFVGGQDEVDRDYRYGLVVPIGVVDVRCEMDVVVGDYVTVNHDGVAKKVNGSFGYRVVALNDITQVTFATIILSTQGDKLSDIYDEICMIDKQMNTMEENITGAVFTANMANNKIDALQKDFENLSDNVGNVSSTLDGVQNEINDLWGASDSTNASVGQLRAELETQINEASAQAKEAADNANVALGDVSALIKDVEPLTTWTNGQESGATYLVEYINNGVATKAEVETASNNARNALTSVEKNAFGIQSLASSISIYSVGEFSQAHGFSIDDAIATMGKGMVYVPTVDHSETYVRDVLSVVDGQDEIDSSGALDGGSLEDRLVRGVITAAPVQAYDMVDYTMEFTKGYYYVWNGERWDESDSVAVFFSETYVIGNDNAPYWYTCDASVTHPEKGIVYASETLHLWQDDHWVAVATTKHNATAKMISLVNQTTDAFSIELVNARGSTASLDVRLDDNESKISLLTQWQGTASDTMAGLEIKSDEQEAKINQFTTWQSETSNKITSIEQVSNEQGARIEQIASAEDANAKSIAQVEQKATANEAQISQLATTVAGNTTTIAAVDAKADANAAEIQQTASALTGELDTLRGSTTEIAQRVSKTESDISLLGNTVSDQGEAIASVEARTNATEASINTITEWQGDTEKSIASVEQTVSSQGAQIEIAVNRADEAASEAGEAKAAATNGASIVASINANNESTVQIKADKLQLSGVTEFVRPGDLSESGKTIINGDNITTGTIKAERIQLDGDAVIQAVNDDATIQIEAARLNLDGVLTVGDLDGYATTDALNSYTTATDFEAYQDALVNGKTTIDGGCVSTGVITAQIASVGGWTVSDSYIYSQTDLGTHFYMTSNIDDSDYWISAYDGSETSFYVDKNGILFARGADIGGTISAMDGNFGKCSIYDNGLVFNKDVLRVSDIESSYIYFADPNMYNVFIGVDGGADAQTLRISAQGNVIFESAIDGCRPYLYQYMDGNQLVTKAEMEAAIAKALAGGGASETVAAPVISPSSGTFDGLVTVTITCATEGATIWYEKTGESAGTFEYTGPFDLYSDFDGESVTVIAWATKNGMEDSVYERADFTIMTV